MNFLVLCENQIVAKSVDDALEIVDQDRVPIALLLGMNLRDWISSRALDGSRTHGRILKKTHGLSSFASDFDTAMKYHAAIITDNYWVKEESENIAYEDVIFKDDKYFQMAISQDATALENKSSKTPELTNIGSQEKGWKLINGEWWLYKNETPSEICHEILTSLIGQELGFDMAMYEYSDGYIRSKDFTQGKFNLQHADSIMKEHTNSEGKEIVDEDWKYNYSEFLSLGSEIANDYLKILYLDAICNNVDRHTKNYGLLTDRKTGDIVGMAPNYDNNMAFYGVENDTNTSNKLSRDFVDFIKENNIDFLAPKGLDIEKVKKQLNAQFEFVENIEMLLKYAIHNMNYINEELE